MALGGGFAGVVVVTFGGVGARTTVCVGGGGAGFGASEAAESAGGEVSALGVGGASGATAGATADATADVIAGGDEVVALGAAIVCVLSPENLPAMITATTMNSTAMPASEARIGSRRSIGNASIVPVSSAVAFRDFDPVLSSVPARAIAAARSGVMSRDGVGGPIRPLLGGALIRPTSPEIGGPDPIGRVSMGEAARIARELGADISESLPVSRACGTDMPAELLSISAIWSSRALRM